ncbi:hypothetical protein M9458_039781, partial [Cirrhinus mrigala]
FQEAKRQAVAFDQFLPCRAQASFSIEATARYPSIGRKDCRECYRIQFAHCSPRFNAV